MDQKNVLLTLINIVSVPAALIAAFAIFFMGAFASDSGTTAALTVSLVMMGLALLYPILTIVAIIYSRKRRSYLIALLPVILPVALLIFIFSPAFSFS